MRFEPWPCSYNLILYKPVPYVLDYYSLLPFNSSRSIQVITKNVSHLTRLPCVIVASLMIQGDQCTIKMSLRFPVMGICYCDNIISQIIVKVTAGHDNNFFQQILDGQQEAFGKLGTC